MSYQELKTKYRPKDFDQVLGQNSTVSALKEYAKSGNWPHCILFTGGAGRGKTTLARIIFGKYLKITPKNLIEIDAATTNSIESVRELLKTVRSPAMGESRNRGWLLDECHRYSKQAWDGFLKSTEEPPEHAFFIFCTTELEKVPKTIQTRSVIFNLSPVSSSELIEFAIVIAELEGIKIPEKSLITLARESDGSPRSVLTKLERCRGLTEHKEVLQAIQAPDEDVEIVELCRDLSKPARATWPNMVERIKSLGDANPESVRILISAYFAKVLLNTSDERTAVYFLNILEAFSEPYVSSDKMAPLLRSIGRVVFDNSEE